MPFSVLDNFYVKLLVCFFNKKNATAETFLIPVYASVFCLSHKPYFWLISRDEADNGERHLDKSMEFSVPI